MHLCMCCLFVRVLILILLERLCEWTKNHHPLGCFSVHLGPQTCSQGVYFLDSNGFVLHLGSQMVLIVNIILKLRFLVPCPSLYEITDT